MQNNKFQAIFFSFVVDRSEKYSKNLICQWSRNIYRVIRCQLNSMSKFNQIRVLLIHRRFDYEIVWNEWRKKNSIHDLNMLSIKDFPTNRLTTSHGTEHNGIKSKEGKNPIECETKTSIEFKSYTRKFTNISSAICLMPSALNCKYTTKTLNSVLSF